MNPRPGFVFALAAALGAAALHFSASGCAETGRRVVPAELRRCVDDLVDAGATYSEAELLCGGPRVRDLGVGAALEATVKVPIAPNFLRVVGDEEDDQPVDVADVSDGELRRLGEAWTEALIENARSRAIARDAEKKSGRKRRTKS